MTNPLRALLAVPLAALVAVGVLAPAATATAADAATVVVQPLTDAGVPLTGPFDIRADVTMNAAGSVDLKPVLLYATKTSSSQVFLDSKTVTPDTCPGTCQVQWSFDPTAKAIAWADGSVSISVAVTQGSDPVVYARATGGTFVSPVADLRGATPTPFERAETVNTPGYATNVFDTTGTVRVTSATARAAGEVLYLSLRKGTGTTAQEVASYPGAWNGPDPVTGATTGQVKLDVTTVAEAGTYYAYVQGATASGQWGAPRYLGVLSVRHNPVSTWAADSPILPGSASNVLVTVRYPTTGYTPVSLEVRVNTGAVLTFQANLGAYDQNGNQYQVITLPASALPAGTTAATGRLVDNSGAVVGPQVTFPVVVAAFTETVTAPPLVVGHQTPVTIKGTAPAGGTYSYCDFKFYDAAGLNPYADGTVCQSQKSFTKVTNPIPRAAGPGRFELTPVTTTGLQQLRTFPVTVYSDRVATLTSPATSSYNSALKAVVKVSDRYDVTKSPRAASGVAVSLQRKVAGTSTWSTIATGKTDTYGNATVTFANTTSGRLRVLTSSAVPKQWVVSGERAVTSVSTVAWSSLPTSAYRGALVTAKVRTSPYESGATVRLQARRQGTSTWYTLASKSVASTGYATPTFRISSAGTWQVRVVRDATTRHGVGYSSVRTLAVR